MKSIILGLATAAAVSGCALSASATTIEATYTGHVQDGCDYSGVFTTGSGDLAGLAYTAVFVFDTALASQSYASPTQNYVFGGSDFAGGALTFASARLTINGKTALFAPSSYGEANGENDGPGQYSEQYHQVKSQFGGLGVALNSTLDERIYNVGGTLPADIVGSFSYTVGATDGAYGSFQYDRRNTRTGDEVFAYGNLVPETLTVGVPEPSTWILAALAFGGAGLAGRLRRRARVEPA